jgi:hypothetical protein
MRTLAVNGPGTSDHLVVPEWLGILPQLVEIGRVTLRPDPLPLGGGREGVLHAAVVAVDDHDGRAAATGHAAQDCRGEHGAVPELVARHDNAQGGSIAGLKWPATVVSPPKTSPRLLTRGAT